MLFAHGFGCDQNMCAEHLLQDLAGEGPHHDDVCVLAATLGPVRDGAGSRSTLWACDAPSPSPPS